MSIDGFVAHQRDAFVAYTPETAKRFFAGITALGRRLRITVEGLDHLPAGRALIVANHTFGWDVAFPIAAVWKRFHRPVYTLGEHAWWRVPFLRRLAAAVGTVDGTPANTGRLLDRDELVLVLPGGLREAVKPHELRYRLLWGQRFGFVRAALRHQAPIVPLAAVGMDDLFDFVGNAYRRGERWLRRSGIPIPLPSRILPIPHLVQLEFVFGEAIPPRAASDQADDVSTLKQVRHEVEGALHELLETELAKRAGIEVR